MIIGRIPGCPKIPERTPAASCEQFTLPDGRWDFLLHAARLPFAESGDN